MKLRWLIPIALLLPMRSSTAEDHRGRITRVVVDEGSITPLHLHPGFESVIRLPEEVTSVVVGSPVSFHVEHSEGEPNFVYVKPAVSGATQSDLLIAMKSGLHVVLELMSDGDDVRSSQATDFLLEYRTARSLVILDDVNPAPYPLTEPARSELPARASRQPPTAIEEALLFRNSVNVPVWKKWQGKPIETSLGDIRELGDQTLVSFSLLNVGPSPVEIVPPQIQMDGQKLRKKGKSVLADQLEVRGYRLTASRLDPGDRVDGVCLFDRPSFKTSKDTLFLQLAQRDQIDQPILIRLPFTPPLAAKSE